MQFNGKTMSVFLQVKEKEYEDGFSDGLEQGFAEGQAAGYSAGKAETVERYCPDFAVSGAVVKCYPVQDYPICVISHIVPVQDGSGDTSPTNIRPILGVTCVNLYNENEEEETWNIRAEMGQPVYGGNYDWNTGLLTLTHKMFTVTGKENWTMAGTYGVMCTSVNGESIMGDSVQNIASPFGYCSHAPTGSDGKVSWNYIRKVSAARGLEVVGFANGNWGEDLREITVAKWKEYIKAQQDAGTPIQIAYKLDAPLTIQLEREHLTPFGLIGENTLYSDSGETTITGKSDPIALLEELTAEVVALGGEI